MFDRDLSFDTVDDLLEVHGARLSVFLGKTIDRIWVAWDVARDEWFADEAVILEAGGTALEIVCWRLSDIVLSWNAIDRGEPPHWVAEWGAEFNLEWRCDAIPGLREAAGKRIMGINVIEYLHRTTVIQDRRNPANVGRRHEEWLLHGLELELPGSTLEIFNNLDQNGVAFERFTGDVFRRVPVRQG